MKQGYLCIKRLRGQKILIEGGIEVVIIDIQSKTVKLGVKAPSLIVRRPDKETDEADKLAWVERMRL